MKKLLMAPIWLVQLFTQTKSFTRNPIIGSTLANRMGLHVARIVIAHTIMRLRMLMLSRGISKAHKKSYFSNGFILIPDFLSTADYAELKRQIESADAEVRECTQGDTLTHRIMLDEQSLQNLPQAEQFLQNPKLKKLLKFASGVNGQPVSYIQTIKNQFVEGPQDPQKNLHSDTFHPTMKSWYFIDDVDERNGPFTYVPGSQQLTMARLRWEYRRSIEISTDGDPYSGNGSLRLSENDAKEMGLAPAKGFKVTANTLVVANTHGFHCRGHASERSTRTELWTISRTNPFNPFPGIDHPLLTNLQNKVLDAYRIHCDRKAEQRGVESSWHVIDARNTINADVDQSTAQDDLGEQPNVEQRDSRHVA